MDESKSKVDSGEQSVPKEGSLPASEPSVYPPNILDNLDEAFISIDFSNKITRWNKGAERIFHYSPEEALGKPVSMLMPAGLADEKPVLWERIKRGERVNHFETHRVRKDGHVINVLLLISPVRDAAGQVNGMTKIVRDITELKRSGENESSLALFPQENPSPVLRISRDGVLLYANRASTPLLESWGCCPGQPAPEIFSQCARHALEIRENCAVELACGPRLFSFSVAPIATRDYANLYGCDITESRKAETDSRQAHDRLKTILESITDCFYSLDRQWCFIDVNEAAERFLRKTRAELLGRNIWETFPEMAGTVFQQQYQQALHVNRTAHFEAQHPTMDCWLEVHAYPSAEGLTVYSRDGSERKRFQEELLRAKQEWECTFDGVPELIAIIDCQHRIVRANRAMVERLGIAVGKGCGELFCYKCVHGTAVRPEFCPHSKTLLDGQRHEAEIYEERLGGYFQVSTTPLVTNKGEVIGSVHVAHDITERKRIEQQVRESNQFLGAILNHTHMLVACMDRKFNFLMVNRAYARADGREPGFFPGKNHFELYPNYENEAIFLRVLETGLPYFVYGKPFTYPNHPEQRVTYWDWSLIPIKDEAGSVTQVVLTLLDVTEPKRAEQALSQSEERFRLAVSAMNEALYDWDMEKNLLWWNSFYEQFCGPPPARDEGVNWWMDRLHPEDHDRVWASFQGALEGQCQYWSSEYRVRRTDNTYAHVLDRATIARDTQGKPVHLVGAMLDLTAQKQAEAELKEAQGKLQEHNQQLEETVDERTRTLRETIGELESFSYSITHDLRAPLRSMKIFSTMLLEDCKDASATTKDYAIRISKAAHRMDLLIQDILTYSRISRKELSMSPVDAIKLLRDIIDTYPDFGSGNAEITIDGQFPLLFANEAALTQCFSNLLGNAVKFVAPGQMPKIKIQAELKGQQVRIWFQDNGIGLRREHIEKIFGIFERLHPQYEGTGIGLAIVKKAVERMGGKVGVESEVGKGSRFWLELLIAS